MTSEDKFNFDQRPKELIKTLIGSVKPFAYLFLLEYHGTFGAKAVEDSSLPEEVKGHISLGLKTISDQLGSARLFLIKNQASHAGRRKKSFCFHNDPQNPVLRRYTLERYEQLLRAPLKNLIDPKGGDLVEKPMYLICTNGLRDKCCSIFGFPLYRKLYQELKNSDKYVWECSHVGGHRFAGNVIALPNGCYYGLVEESDVDTLVAHTENKEIYLDKLRGRSSLPILGQVAEKFLREHQKDQGQSGFEWEGIENLDGDQIQTKAKLNDKRFWVNLKKEMVMLGGSCENPEDKECEQYVLVDIQRR